MFPAWRLQLREARLAVAAGRWDEAAELLQSESLREFYPAKQLSQKLAAQLAERAKLRIAQGHSTAGWRDLDRAARLGLGEAAVSGVRQEQAQQRLDEAVELLAKGEAAAARKALQRMDQRRLGGSDRRTWEVVAQHMETADLRARKGDLAAAIDELSQAQRLLPASGADRVAGSLKSRIANLRESIARQHELDAQLHAALAAGTGTKC